MIQYFTDCHDAIKSHAAKEYPNEACGIIINDEYQPCRNLALNPKEHFKIPIQVLMAADTKLQAIVHSHADYPHLSAKDIQQQTVSGVPWGWCNVSKGKPGTVYFWGNRIQIQDLDGRPFVFGIYDCFSLVRDFYQVHFDIELENIPREVDFFKNNDLIGKSWKPQGFKMIDKKDLTFGDLLLMKIRNPIYNHIGIYIDDNLILHHLANQLSRYDDRIDKYLQISDVVSIC